MPHADDASPILLVIVPGVGIAASDFQDRDFAGELARRRWPVKSVIIDPGPEAYLDDVVEARMWEAIDAARLEAGAERVWLAGISLGCQGILRCVRARPGVAEGALLLTPYLASTGLVAEVARAGGLRRWAADQPAECKPEQALLVWLARTAALPRMLVGHALQDRFATTSRLLGDILPDGRMISIEGAHDWESWTTLWRLMLDRNPFEQPMATAAS